MFSTRRALGISVVLVLGLSVQALAATSNVSLVTVAGSRTMTVKSIAGDDIATMSLGTGRQAPFLVNVSDVAYDRKNYQVSAMLSNLYKFDAAASTFDCNAASVPSSKVSIGFLANPTSARDIQAIASPTLTFSGTITDPALLALIGKSSPTFVSVGTTQQKQSFATSTVFSGAETVLPLKIDTGTGGTFTQGAPHPTCSPVGGSATSVQVQQGDVDVQADVLAWVQSTANESFNTAAGPGGILSINEALNSELITQSVIDSDVRDALTSSPVSANPLLVTDVVIAQVEALLTATGTDVATIVGQSGTYASLPKLVVGDLSGIPSGTYRGVLTVTLIEE